MAKYRITVEVDAPDFWEISTVRGDVMQGLEDGFDQYGEPKIVSIARLPEDQA